MNKVMGSVQFARGEEDWFFFFNSEKKNGIPEAILLINIRLFARLM